MTRPRFSEDDNDLLCLFNIEDQVVDFAPVHQMFHLVPVGQFIVILDEAHNSCVVRILELNLGRQSWVIRVNSRGLRTQPLGEPVSEAQVTQFAHQILGDDRVERWLS